jgi:tetratricopeptide (TPR) repeat protein
MKTLLLFLTLCCPLWLGAEEAMPPTALEQADQLFSAGQLEQAETRYQEALAAEPDNIEIYMRLGGFYLSQVRVTDAIQQFQAALGVNPEFARAFAALGIAYWHNGNYALAEAALQEALRLQPDLPEAANLLQTLQQKTQILEQHHQAPKTQILEQHHQAPSE